MLETIILVIEWVELRIFTILLQKEITLVEVHKRRESERLNRRSILSVVSRNQQEAQNEKKSRRLSTRNFVMHLLLTVMRNVATGKNA